MRTREDDIHCRRETVVLGLGQEQPWGSFICNQHVWDRACPVAKAK